MNDLTTACVTYGPLIATVVAILKRIPWIGGILARNAKVVAMIASTVVALITAGAIPIGTAQWALFGACVAAVFSGAVATHEVVDGTFGKQTGLTDPKRQP